MKNISLYTVTLALWFYDIHGTYNYIAKKWLAPFPPIWIKFHALLYLGNLREEISKYISPDQLPALYGGDRYEPDAECSDYIQHGGDVDPKYYLTNCTETSKEDMERVVVGRGSSHKVRHQVAEVGCTLQWEFFTTDYDIAFRVSMKKRVRDKEERQTIVRKRGVCQQIPYINIGGRIALWSWIFAYWISTIA